MSGLQNFLTPFSQLLFANRNLVIFFLCLFLFLAALDALIHRWKTQRLNQDLSAAKSGGAFGSSGRRYSNTPPPAEEANEPGGALPPVKGGRTYARNLGSALQKAGIPTQQIYSPPTPQGWAANTNPGQPMQPGATPQYPGPAAPWAAPAAPATPWAFQGGAGRPPAGPPAIPVPFYQPQPTIPPPQPTAMPQPPMPGPGFYPLPSPTPGAYTPPPPPYGQPAFPLPGMGPAAPAPAFSPPGPPNPSMAPAFPGPVVPAAEPPASDAGRRGKPKRRRFTFNVLENIEKMVQPKPAEPLPTSSWTPPSAAPAAPAVPSDAGFQTSLQPTAATTPPAPTAAPALPVKPVTPRAASLPPQFGVPEDVKATPAAEPEVEQPMIDFAGPATEEKTTESAGTAPETAAAPSEPESVIEPERKPDARRSMRSMMFGEEVAAPEAEAESEPESVPAAEAPSTKGAETPASAGSKWTSYPWERSDEASSAADELAASESAAAGEATADASPDAEPARESTSSDTFDPWRPSYAPEGETALEPVSTSETEAVPAFDTTESTHSQVPEEPADGAKPGAGTLVIIEDDSTAASYYATLFRGNGYQVEVANDGVSGVDLCTRVQPQVILLDVMMPRQNGILVLQTLRASDETKNTPVVVMSNFSEPTLIKRALQLGALEYVIKTQVEGPALLNAVPRWMNREKAFAA